MHKFQCVIIFTEKRHLWHPQRQPLRPSIASRNFMGFSFFFGEGDIFHGVATTSHLWLRSLRSRNYHYSPGGSYVEAAAAARIKFTGGIVFSRGENICETLICGRYAVDLTENLQIYIVYPTCIWRPRKGTPSEFRKVGLLLSIWEN